MRISILLVFILTFLSCGQNENSKILQENIKVKIGKFSADSAYTFIEKQVDFGKRYMNSRAHEDCRDWLIEKLESYNIEVIAQHFEAKSYDGITLKGTNIIGRYNPNVKEKVLLCAHYDTRHIADKDTVENKKPIDGADDGGSGVGVILEIARQLDKNPIPMGVDIIFFDAEDYGSDTPGYDYSWGLGSQFWSKNLHEKNYVVKYGILLDMVGAKDATFPKEGYSMKSSEREVNKIWNFAKAIGNGKYFVDRKVGFYTDDHRFIIENTNIRMLNVINIKSDGKFGKHHHTHSDNIEIIDRKTLKAVGQVILATVHKESNKEEF